MQPHPSPVDAAPGRNIRVLLVDDSAVVRGLIARWLEAEAGVEVAGAAADGAQGVALAGQLKPDVVVLDVEMPGLDGLGAIPQILKAAPQARILMSSTLTRRNAEITLKALQAGASDYLAKPTSAQIGAGGEFQRELVAKIRALGLRGQLRAQNTGPLRLRPPLQRKAEIIVIASSTGGPQALSKVITELGGRISAPVLIVQHMPPTFTAILAEQLSKLSPASVVEGADLMPVRSGGVYIAPGDHHMRVTRAAGAPVIAIDRGPPENYCRPAADPLFTSAAEIFGASTLGVVLTGMGADGRRGADAIVTKGGAVIVQDETSSVVWGMPGAVATAGLACAVRPLPEIASTILTMARGARA